MKNNSLIQLTVSSEKKNSKVLWKILIKIKILNLFLFDFNIYVCFHVKDQAIGLMGRAFANGQGDWGSILGQVIPKTQKMVLDATLTLSIIR